MRVIEIYVFADLPRSILDEGVALQRREIFIGRITVFKEDST